jgi:hypothetical protein
MTRDRSVRWRGLADIMLGVLVGLAPAAPGCGGGASGGERQACYPNDTCNAGLVCLSRICVAPGSGGTGGGAGSTGAGAGGRGTGAGGGGFGAGGRGSGG